MLQYIKDKFLKEPELIKTFLEHYDYHHIVIKQSYITFARSADSSPKSITIYLQDNDALIVKDWARNLSADIFNYVIKEKGVSFKEVIQYAKTLVGIEGYYQKEEGSRKAFNGFYSKIKNRNKVNLKIYDDSILDKYIPCGNRRFLNDGISLKAQRCFNIGYDAESQAISIPIYSEDGSLIGVKFRVNHEVEDGEQKYYYDVPCQMSCTLYGYAQNYQYLESNDVIIFEAEKSVLQSRTMKIYNTVALGSSSISKKQCQMILSLNPKRVIFCLDKGLDFEVLKRNMRALRVYGKMKEFDILYWKPKDDVPDKSSPSDLGEKKFRKILEEDLIIYEESI